MLFRRMRQNEGSWPALERLIRMANEGQRPKILKERLSGKILSQVSAA